MPNQLTGAGLQVKTAEDILFDIIEGLMAIYGVDVNVAQDTPDGQLVNILAQAMADQLELLEDVYNTFSPTAAYGQILDQRLALNGMTRRAGTYTRVSVDVTTDRALNLTGLDDDPTGETVFTIADDAGVQFYLEESQVIAGAGTNAFSFRAKDVGNVQVLANTITNQVTITLGVTAVNNPSTPTEQGVDEETDAQLKVRHAQSFALASTSPADAVEAAIAAIPAVTDVLVAENNTDSAANGVPARSIWVIVENGEKEDIAAAIYAKKAPGCGMQGAVTQDVVRPNGLTFTAKFDRPIEQTLYARFALLPKSTGVTFDEDLIKTQLAAALQYRLRQEASIGDVVAAMLSIAPGGFLTDVEVSDDGASWGDVEYPTSYQHKFVITAARITIL